MTPNLFDYATSELSQDAFLCWLLAWADIKWATDEEYSHLHRVSVAFLRKLFETGNGPIPVLPSPVRVLRQVDRVDVVALVGDTHVVVIEDKKHAGEHGEQLVRYAAALGDRFRATGGPVERHLLCVYLKTGDQSSYDEVRARGWGVFTRRELLAVLRTGADVRSDIFRNFVAHMEAIEANVERYRSVPASTWGHGDPAWTGFYMAVREALSEGAWGYVPNPSGGFMGFWFGWQQVPDARVYLQLEERRRAKAEEPNTVLCVKVEVPREFASRRSQIRQTWSARLTAVAGPLRFTRPTKFGTGAYMTVAELKGSYLVTGADGRVDIAETARLLQRASGLLQTLVAESKI